MLATVTPILGFGLVALTSRWPALFRVLVAEDGVLEWLQVVGFTLAAAGFALAARRGRLVGWARVGAVALAVILAFVVGEELSWGQRHLGVEVAAVQEVNDQGDLTIHNVGAGFRLSQLGLVALALVLGAVPWVYRRPRLVRRLGLPEGAGGPPSWLSALLATAVAFTLARLAAFPSPSYEVAKLSEVAELVVAAGSIVVAGALARDVPRPDASRKSAVVGG